MTDGTPGRGRTLATPQFPDDDGTAAPEVRTDLRRAAAGDLPVRVLARRLRSRRLFTGVVAVLDSMGEDGEEKDSHMAVVSMVSATGERGLLAFTGTESLTAWDPAARPVPALGRDIARAALEDGARAVVLDVRGPASVALTGSALRVLADELDLSAVSQRAIAVLPVGTAPTVVRAADWAARAGLDPAEELDADVVVLVPGAAASDAAAVLAADAELVELVPGGLAVVAVD